MPRLSLTPRQLREVIHCPSVLMDVVEDVLDRWPNYTATCTSIYRSKAEDQRIGGSGIHSTYRALDIRIRDLRGRYQAMADRLAQEVNQLWIYDPDRPHLGVIFSKPHGSGPHIHIQVHPRTRRRPSDAEIA